MNKSLTQANQVGRIAERFFEIDFADQVGFSPQKHHLDIGVDYYVCELFDPDNPKSQRKRDNILGVSVKGSEQDPPKALLDASDLEMALGAEYPLMYFLFDVNNKKVYYRFLDVELYELFAKQLRAGHDSFILSRGRLKEFGPGFDDALRHYLAPKMQNQLQLLRREQRVEKIVGPSHLHLSASRGGSQATLLLPNIEWALTDQEAFRETLRDVFLVHRPRGHELPKEALKEGLFEELDRLADSHQILAKSRVNVATLTVKGSAGEASCDFLMKRFRDEIAFAHHAGLSLIVSEARKSSDGGMHHFFECRLDEKMRTAILTHQDLRAFVECSVPQARVYVDGTSFCDVENWAPLSTLAGAVKQAGFVYQALDIKDPPYAMADSQHKGISSSFAFLEWALKLEAGAPLRFMLAPDDAPLPADWTPAQIEFPVTVLLPEGATVIRARFFGKIGLAEGHQPKDAQAFQLDKCESLLVLGTATTKAPLEGPLMGLNQDRWVHLDPNDYTGHSPTAVIIPNFQGLEGLMWAPRFDWTEE